MFPADAVCAVKANRRTAAISEKFLKVFMTLIYLSLYCTSLYL
jgi:hypothetical protein